jgi:hypothetical protein
MTFSTRVSTLVLLTLCALIPLNAQTTQYDFSAQAAAVTEFDVNGLKVILKRRPSSPTVAGGLFIRGGARNIDDKSAGIENLMLASAIEAGVKMPRAVVRRELARLGVGISSGTSNDYSAVSLVSTRANFDRVWEIFCEVMLNPAFAKADIDLQSRTYPDRPSRSGIESGERARGDGESHYFRRTSLRQRRERNTGEHRSIHSGRASRISQERDADFETALRIRR